jgi:hypothetical protein
MKRDLVLLGLAIAAGALVGYIDLGASEVFVPAGMILVFTFVLGMLAPRLAWLWGIVVGLGVPVMHGIIAIRGQAQPYPFDWSGVFLPIMFGLAGAYAGWFVRRVMAAGSGQT